MATRPTCDTDRQATIRGFFTKNPDSAPPKVPYLVVGLGLVRDKAGTPQLPSSKAPGGIDFRGVTDAHYRCLDAAIPNTPEGERFRANLGVFKDVAGYLEGITQTETPPAPKLFSQAEIDTEYPGEDGAAQVIGLQSTLWLLQYVMGQRDAEKSSTLAYYLGFGGLAVGLVIGLLVMRRTRSNPFLPVIQLVRKAKGNPDLGAKVAGYVDKAVKATPGNAKQRASVSVALHNLLDKLGFDPKAVAVAKAAAGNGAKGARKAV